MKSIQDISNKMYRYLSHIVQAESLQWHGTDSLQRILFQDPEMQEALLADPERVTEFMRTQTQEICKTVDGKGSVSLASLYMDALQTQDPEYLLWNAPAYKHVSEKIPYFPGILEAFYLHPNAFNRSNFSMPATLNHSIDAFKKTLFKSHAVEPKKSAKPSNTNTSNTASMELTRDLIVNIHDIYPSSQGSDISKNLAESFKTMNMSHPDILAYETLMSMADFGRFLEGNENNYMAVLNSPLFARILDAPHLLATLYCGKELYGHVVSNLWEVPDDQIVIQGIRHRKVDVEAIKTALTVGYRNFVTLIKKIHEGSLEEGSQILMNSRFRQISKMIERHDPTLCGTLTAHHNIPESSIIATKKREEFEAYTPSVSPSPRTIPERQAELLRREEKQKKRAEEKQAVRGSCVRVSETSGSLTQTVMDLSVAEVLASVTTQYYAPQNGQEACHFKGTEALLAPGVVIQTSNSPSLIVSVPPYSTDERALEALVQCYKNIFAMTSLSPKAPRESIAGVPVTMLPLGLEAGWPEEISIQAAYFAYRLYREEYNTSSRVASSLSSQSPSLIGVDAPAIFLSHLNFVGSDRQRLYPILQRAECPFHAYTTENEKKKFHEEYRTQVVGFLRANHQQNPQYGLTRLMLTNSQTPGALSSSSLRSNERQSVGVIQGGMLGENRQFWDRLYQDLSDLLEKQTQKPITLFQGYNAEEISVAISYDRKSITIEARLKKEALDLLGYQVTESAEPRLLVTLSNTKPRMSYQYDGVEAYVRPKWLLRPRKRLKKKKRSMLCIEEIMHRVFVSYFRPILQWEHSKMRINTPLRH